jgi:hypothetical protein
MPVNCTQCGATLEKNARFCTNCGAVVSVRPPRAEKKPDMDLSEYFDESPARRREAAPPQARRSAPAAAPRAAAPARRPAREPEAKPRKNDRGLNIALLICGMLAIAAITFLLIFLLTDSSRDGGQTPQGGAAIATASPQPVLVPPVTTDPVTPPNAESPSPVPVAIITPTPLPTLTPATPAPPTPAPATPAPPTPAPAPDYLLPDSDSRYLTEADLAGLTHEQLCFARNEIFARHGRIFKTPEIAAYFNSKPWYKGTIAPDKFDEHVLNKYESANVGLIRDYEKKYYGGSYY